MIATNNYTRPLGVDGLHLLYGKYEELILLRKAREDWQEAGELRTPDEALAERQKKSQTLAKAFPGALRQLECLDVNMLCRRREVIASCLHQKKKRHERIELWLCVEWDYHLLHKEALAFKDWKNSKRKEELSGEAFVEFLTWWKTEVHCATPIESMSEGLFLEWCKPPGGRFSKLIWRCLQEYYKIPEASLKQMIFADAIDRAGEQ